MLIQRCLFGEGKGWNWGVLGQQKCQQKDRGQLFGSQGTCATSEMLFITRTLVGGGLGLETLGNCSISSEPVFTFTLKSLSIHTTLTSWHKHRYCQSVDSSSVLPPLCPETHTLPLVALPSLSYDLGVKEEGKKKKSAFAFPQTHLQNHYICFLHNAMQDF